jgi:hypothetical protein
MMEGFELLELGEKGKIGIVKTYKHDQCGYYKKQDNVFVRFFHWAIVLVAL